MAELQLVNDSEKLQSTVDKMRNVGTSRKKRRRRKRGKKNNRRQQVNNILWRRERRGARNKGAMAQSMMLSLNNNIVTKPVHSYLECIVNPFDPNANGAIRPDGNNMPTTALIDRITFEIDIAGFEYAGNTTLGYPTQVSVSQVAILFLPRCVSAGWIQGTYNNVPFNVGPGSDFIQKEIILDVPFSNTSSTSVTNLDSFIPWWYPYTLCVLFINDDGRVVRLPSADEIANNPPDDWPKGPTFVNFSRTTYSQQCAGMRILGAGIKALPLGPPINTGGIVYAGTISQEILYQQLVSNKTNAAFGSSETLLRNWSRFLGKDGCTIRYDPVQTQRAHLFHDGFTNDIFYNVMIYDPYDLDIDEEKEAKSETPSLPPMFKKGIVGKRKVLDSFDIEDCIAPPLRKQKRLRPKGGSKDKVKDKDLKYFGSETFTLLSYWNSEPAIEDMCNKDDQLPMILYKFDRSTQGTTNNVDSYNIQVEAVMHGEMVPTGLSPYISEKLPEQPGLKHLEGLTTNYDVCPLAEKGSSFKSVLQSFRRFIGRVPRYADSASKIAKIIEDNL